jgi:outer membrane lipoprotein-sorting protein
VPGTAVVIAGAVIAASQITVAQAAPALPARTPAQLLAQVSSDAKLPPLTGTVVETTSLGLPQLPRVAGSTSLSSLITGSHTVNLYYQSPQHFRVQVPQTMSEIDAIRDGNTLWYWDSTKNAVTEYTVPKAALKPSASRIKDRLPTGPVLTPQQAANEVLKAVGKTTAVSVQSNAYVAGEPAYQLVLAPKDKRSLVGQVVIAIDGKYGVPLRLQVFAKGAKSPAFQVGFTQIAFVTPAASNLQFTPPPGTKVTKVNLGSDITGQTHPGGTPAKPATSGLATYGSGWLTVAEFPQSDISTDTPFALPGGGGPIAGSSSQSIGSSSAPAGQPSSPQLGVGALGGSSQEILHALMLAAKPVHGTWGSGTLLTTSLMSMLITKGEVYVGAVQPSVLYAAVGHAS